MLQLATVGVVLMKTLKTAKPPPAATAMLNVTISTTAAMTSHQSAAIVRARYLLYTKYGSVLVISFVDVYIGLL